MPLEFEWDEAKSNATFEQRGIDFEYATLLFLGPVLETPSNRDGEMRIKAVGKIDGLYYTVIYTIRESRYRIISARRAQKGEERSYRQAYPG